MCAHQIRVTAAPMSFEGSLHEEGTADIRPAAKGEY